MKKQRIVLLILALFWMSIIFLYSAQPSQQSSELSQEVVIKLQEFETVTSFLKKWITIQDLEYFVRKTAHIIEYAVLGGIIVLNSKNWFLNKGRKFYIIGSELFCVFYAVSDDLHQYFVPGRSCQISDVILDSLGALAGILLMILITGYIQKKFRISKI